MKAKGKIVDSVTLEALPGATVAAYMQPQCIQAPCNPMLLGGTTTDLNGMFDLTVPQGTSFVQVSYVGYQKQVPTFQDGILQRIHMVRSTEDVPLATIVANRTYYKYYYAAFALAIVAFIYFKTK